MKHQLSCWFFCLVCLPQTVFAQSSFLIPRSDTGGFALVFRDGKKVADLNAKFVEPFSEGLAAIYNGRGGISYVNENGETIIPGTHLLAYSNVGHSFSEGLAVAEVDTAGLKYGYIDMQGKFVIPATFDGLLPFSEGLARAYDAKSQKYGYVKRVNNTLKWAIPAMFKEARNFKEGFAAVSMDGTKYGYIDKSGKVIIGMNYTIGKTQNLLDFVEGYAVVGLEVEGKQKFAFLGQNGKKLGNQAFDFALPIRDGHGLVAIQNEEDAKGNYYRFGVYSKDSLKLVVPVQYYLVSDFMYSGEGGFSEGLCATNLGYINNKGDVMVDCGNKPISDAYPFRRGAAQVTIWESDGQFRFCLIDKTGKVLWQSPLNKFR
jgi:WG containing repeat